jgi:anthranilate phosphoribosyltransferase
MAACGARVAKHGNRSSSGAVGSADFLEALGAKIDLGPEGTASVLDGCGFAFLFAQSFHPAMRRVAAARKAIGIRSIFNLLGPLTNPAQPACQVIGVSDRSLGPIFAALLRARGARHALVVHSLDGLDEISPAAPTYCWEVRAGLEIEERLLDPKADFGLDPIASLDEVCGGTASARAAAFRRALQGNAGPLRTFIVINAAAGLYVSGLADSLKAAAVMAGEALDQGSANATLVGYLALSKSAAQVQSAEEGDRVPASPSPAPGGAAHVTNTHADHANGVAGNGVVNGTNSGSGRGFHVRRSSQLQSYGSADVPPGNEGDQDRHPAPRDSIAYVMGSEKPERVSYTTAGGIRVTRTKVPVPDAALEIEELGEWLNTNLGAIMLSDYEQPGRYKKWARGFSDPPLMVVGQKRDFTITALNDRGRVLLPAITIALHMDKSIQDVEQADDEINGAVALPEGSFSEEERSKQPSLFSVVRVVSSVFKSAEDNELGLQGAFGYDLTFQFEDTKLRMDRPDHQRDIVLFVPDQIFVWDQTGPSGFRYEYEFSVRHPKMVGESLGE